jgi:hypothetical protein
MSWEAISAKGLPTRLSAHPGGLLENRPMLVEGCLASGPASLSLAGYSGARRICALGSDP